MCCGPYLEQRQLAPTAEALMRSRYSAFVLRNSRYLLSTWDPAHRPARLDLKHDQTEWLGLEIVSTEAGTELDTVGRVAFIARYRSRGKVAALVEHSRFRKVGDAWFYIDGDT